LSIGALHGLVRNINFAAFGVAATVTVPGDPPIATKVIWLTAVNELRPDGSQFPRTESRRGMAIRRDEVPLLPRGTKIEVAEHLLTAPGTWIVDGSEATFSDHHRVVVVPEA
jgi:hypothetical protein